MLLRHNEYTSVSHLHECVVNVRVDLSTQNYTLLTFTRNKGLSVYVANTNHTAAASKPRLC